MTVSKAHTIPDDFELLYIQLRTKENRIYNDKEVAQLPSIDKSHIHYREWQIRKESSKRLISYLKKKKKSLNILEIGCGNGWLSHRLSEIPNCKVVGTDINFTEIQQAANVFQHIPNLHFICAGLQQNIFKEEEFDCIVFAASIQYFKSLKDTIKNTICLLNPLGEIHIIDSPLYQGIELLSARQRSNHYYEKMGVPGMSQFYFHHSLEDIKMFRYTIHYNPKSLFSKILKGHNSFPWISISSNHQTVTKC